MRWIAVGSLVAGIVLTTSACSRSAAPVDLLAAGIDGHWTAGAIASRDGFRCEPGTKTESPDFAVEPFRFYKFEVRLRTQADAFIAALWRNPNATWGRDLQGRPGDLRAEDYQSVSGSEDWQTVVFYSRAQPNATAGCLRVQALEVPVEVEAATVTGPVREDEILSWTERVERDLPPTVVPKDTALELPRTLAALRDGAALRIAFLGDSIMQDAANSPIDFWLEQTHPGLRVEIITAIGGGATMQRWNHPELHPGHDLNLQAAVIDQRPDLVVIGGIGNGGAYDDVRAIVSRVQDGARAIGAPVPDILLMTGPFGEWKRASEGPTQADDEDARQLRAIATESGIAFFDLRHVWIESMNAAIATGQRPGKFYRDAIHGSAAGKHLQGRLILARLATASSSSR